MREVTRVVFETTGTEADRRVIEEYVLDAINRLSEQQACDRVGFAPQGQLLGEGGELLLFFEGDSDTILEREREKWDALVEEGLILDWESTEATERFMDIFGEQGGELYLRLHHIVSQMSWVAFEEFETPPAAVDAYPDEETAVSVGWWVTLHLLTVHQGYTIEAEFDAYVKGVEHALDNITEYNSPRRAVNEIDDLIESLERRRETITDGDR